MVGFPDLAGMSPLEQISGEGGYGDVFLYEQHTPRRRVAVKVLRDQHLTEKVRRQFMSEADAMAQLAHPHIVPVYSAGLSTDGRPFIVMEFFPGQSLGHRAAAERIPVAEVLSIGVKIGSAIETAHRAGMLHRDIKPANILVSKYGEPSLTDFGIAGQMAEVADDDDQGLSLPWAPPEVVFATSPASYSSDVYSLAATLWHLLVGRSPFETVGSRNSQWELMQRIRDLPAPSTGLPIPDSLDRLLRQSMGKDPSHRPRRARDFVLALQSVEQEMRLRPTRAIIEGDAGQGASPAANPLVVPRPDHPSASAGPVATRRHQVIQPSAPRVTPTAHPAAHPSAPPRGPASSAPSGPFGGDPTRRRAVVSQPGTPVTPTQTGPAYSGGPPASRARGPEAGPTIRRSVAPGTNGSAGAPGLGGEASSDSPTRQSPRYGVMALAGGAIVVAAVLAVVLTRGNSAPKPAAASSASSSAGAQGLQGDLIPPGPVTVRGNRVDDTKVTFTWAYSAALPSDTFQWRLDDGATSEVVKTPSLELPAPAGTQVCIRVKVVRADGSNPALDWSVPGCVQ